MIDNVRKLVVFVFLLIWHVTQTNFYISQSVYQCFNTHRWNKVITSEMITVDAVATAAMVRFGSDAELDVTVNKQKKNERENEGKRNISEK